MPDSDMVEEVEEEEEKARAGARLREEGKDGVK
jgi:hypothetical protein